MRKFFVGFLTAVTAIGIMTTTADAFIDQAIGMAHGAYQAHKAQRHYERYGHGGYQGGHAYGHGGYGHGGYHGGGGYGHPGYGHGGYHPHY